MANPVETATALGDLEQELRLHRELVAASGEGIYRLDFDPPVPVGLGVDEQVARILAHGRVAAANAAMAAMYGYASAAELVGRPVAEMLVAEDPITRASLRSFVRGGHRYHDVESVEVDRGGNRRVFLNSAIGVVETGALVAAWGTQRDLTEERRTLERLRQSERRFALAFRVNPAGLAISTLAEGRFVDVNPAFAALIGLSREELLGRTAADLHLWDSPEDRERVVAAIARDGYALRQPARVRRASGELRTALVSAMVMELEGERCMLALAEDVTEAQRTADALKRAEEEQRRLERQMHDAQRLEALGLLAGGVAHDFNNLLTGIQGYAELAARRAEPGSPVGPLLGEILVGARRAAELTQKMLAFAGGARLEVAWVGLNEIVAEVAERARAALPAGREIRLELARPGPGLEGDATHIRQVVTNLLLNAAEALDAAPGTIRVVTGETWCERARLDLAVVGRERQEGRYAYLTVRDDGCGMSDEVRSRIFDPFFSTKFTGRGLGLAAVLGIVRAHQGAIEIESRPGAGSVFTVLLPLALAPGREIAR